MESNGSGKGGGKGGSLIEDGEAATAELPGRKGSLHRVYASWHASCSNEAHCC